jgi:hypothetical protein
MKKPLLILTILPLMLLAKSMEPKVMHAQDRDKGRYEESSHRDTQDEILSSSAEITVQISTVISTEMTESDYQNNARLSYLKNNRIEITEDLAQGEGEHLETLLTMMKLETSDTFLTKIQTNFETLISLSHQDFLNRLKSMA